MLIWLNKRMQIPKHLGVFTQQNKGATVTRVSVPSPV